MRVLIAAVLLCICSAAEAGYPFLQDGGARDSFVSNANRNCKTKLADYPNIPQDRMARYCDCYARAMADALNDQEYEYFIIHRGFPDSFQQKGNAIGEFCVSKTK
jgi:hypothetical protein